MSHVHSDLLVVLAGQPNTGKSTLFSLLTGLHQRIGNYPGVTVEKKSGHYHEGDRRIEVVDLPGTYSFSSYSQEERIARDFILLERPEVIVAVVDASNLRRHLHLLLQLLELQVPTVVCLNMVDMAERWGLKIDFKKLAESLDTPVVPMVGSKGKGLAELRAAILAVSEKTQTLNHEPTGWKIDYPAELGAILVPLEKALDGKEHLIEDFSSRWLAVKLLENDREARRIVQHHTHDDAWKPILEQADAARNSYETVHREPVSEAIVRSRNAKADATVATCITRIKPHARGTDVIDRFVCHPFFGLLLFALIMLVVFQIVFTLANDLPWFPQVGYAHETGWSCEWASPVDACGNFFEEWLPEYLNARLALPETGLFASFLYKGVLAGVGGVLTFVPLIFFMFLTLALLERSGYFARAVVVLDGLLRRFGLHGQSVLPLALAGGIVGGCAVPA
ncbi:MAG TPA: ferrous iron transport protein B, partial [Planctomycetaceae bacterium]|nr:ferrous iron transport protein B [Planctomycetaceae bacterium]